MDEAQARSMVEIYKGMGMTARTEKVWAAVGGKVWIVIVTKPNGQVMLFDGDGIGLYAEEDALSYGGDPLAYMPYKR